MILRPPRSTRTYPLCPATTLFRSADCCRGGGRRGRRADRRGERSQGRRRGRAGRAATGWPLPCRAAARRAAPRQARPTRSTREPRAPRCQRRPRPPRRERAAWGTSGRSAAARAPPPRPARPCRRPSWPRPAKVGGHAAGTVGGGGDDEVIEDKALPFQRGEPVGEQRRFCRRDRDLRREPPPPLLPLSGPTFPP